MGRWFIAIIGLVMVVSCSVKTNEEKVRELVEPQVKANLIKPESYEFAQMRLDSCFSDDSRRNPDVIAFYLKIANLYNDYKKYKYQSESAESSMAIYAPSYGYQSAYSKQQQLKYKTEMEKAKRKADDVKEDILNLYRKNKQLFMGIESAKHEFTGWLVTFGYRAETAGGLKTMGVSIFFLNKDLTEISHSFSEKDMSILESAGLDDLEYEFEEEFNGLYEEE